MNLVCCFHTCLGRFSPGTPISSYTLKMGPLQIHSVPLFWFLKLWGCVCQPPTRQLQLPTAVPWALNWVDMSRVTSSWILSAKPTRLQSFQFPTIYYHACTCRWIHTLPLPAGPMTIWAYRGIVVEVLKYLQWSEDRQITKCYALKRLIQFKCCRWKSFKSNIHVFAMIKMTNLHLFLYWGCYTDMVYYVSTFDEVFFTSFVSEFTVH